MAKPSAETVATAQNFASTFWQRTLAEAHELFNHPSPQTESRTYMRDMKEKLSAETAMLIKIKQMAQTMGGALSDTKRHGSEELQKAEIWMKAAEQQLGVVIPRDNKAKKELNKKQHFSGKQFNGASPKE